MIGVRSKCGIVGGGNTGLQEEFPPLKYVSGVFILGGGGGGGAHGLVWSGGCYKGVN